MKRKSFVSCLIVLALCMSVCLTVFAACATAFDADTLDATIRSIELKNYTVTSTPSSYELDRKIETYDANGKAAIIYIKWTIEDTSLITISEDDETVTVVVPEERAANINYKLRATLINSRGKSYIRADGTAYSFALSRVAPKVGGSQGDDSQGGNQGGGNDNPGGGNQGGSDTPGSGGDNSGGNDNPGGATEHTLTIVMEDQGFTDKAEITTNITTDSGVTIAFDIGTGKTTPSYYKNNGGNAVRLYGGNTMTISGKTIVKVVITFATEYDSNEITTNTGTFATNTWTGSTESLVFTIGGTSGNRRITQLVITYTD